MATHYFYNLSGGIVLRISYNIGPFNEWEEVGHSGKLLVSSGMVSSTVPPIICTSAPTANAQEIVVLHGASWDSKVGDQGNAEVPLGVGTPPKQNWQLTKIE